jgi:hypothetical protein
MKQLLYGINLSTFQPSSGATDLALHLPNQNLFLLSINAQLLTKLNHNDASHYFSKRSYFLTTFTIKGSYD